MRHNVSKVLVIVFVLLGMASGWACGALSRKACKSHRENGRTLGAGIAQAASDVCHVKPCRSQRHKWFVLPDSPSRRYETESSIDRPAPGMPVAAAGVSDLRRTQANKAVLKLPSSYIPPPLFYLHCSIIC